MFIYKYKIYYNKNMGLQIWNKVMKLNTFSFDFKRVDMEKD